MTLEQKRALALATARARATAASVMRPEPPSKSIDDIMDPDNPTETIRAGMGQNIDTVLDGITQLYLKHVRNEPAAVAGLEENIAEKRRLDKPLRDSALGETGAVLGETAQLALPFTKLAKAGEAVTALKAAPKLFKNAGGRLFGQSMGAGAAGGGYELLKPTIGDEDHGDNALFGFGMGAGGNVVGRGLGRVVSGIVPRSRAAGMLPPQVADEATLGQLADRDSFMGRRASRYEEALQSSPLIGPAVQNARNTAARGWRNELIDRVSPSGFKATKETGTREAISDIQDEYGRRYGAALAGTKVKIDPNFEANIMNIVTDPKIALGPNERKQVLDIVANYYGEIAPQGATTMGGPTAKEFESFLSTQARNHAKVSDSATSPEIAKLYSKIEQAWTKSYRPQIPNNADIYALDKTYAPFKTVERAAGSVGNEFGDFTPSQLLNSVKARTPLPKFAAGEGMLQNDASAGKAVFGDKLADSGTVERASSLGFWDPIKTAVNTAASPLFITKTGRNSMMGDAYVQKMLQKLRMDEALRSGTSPYSLATADQE